MDVLLNAILQYGLPIVLVVLFILDIVGPRSRWKREEQRADRATEISAAQVEATRDLTVVVRAFMEAAKK